MRVESVADHLDLVETIGRWHWAALVKHAVRAAAQMGVPTLYLYTVSAQTLYAGLGWTAVADEFYEGSKVIVMERATAT